jgi:hypothetical protein
LRTTGEQQIIGELRPYLDTIVPSKSLTQLKEWVDHQTHQSFAGY